MDILLVCLGNICRSPLAEGILRHKVDRDGLEWNIDSAGTGAWHVGEKPDHRSIKVAEEFSIDITEIRARQLTGSDFDRFDWVIAMDEANFDHINKKDAGAGRARIGMIMDFLYPGKKVSVPDPYYGGDQGFYDIYHLLDQACDALIEEIKRTQFQNT